MLPKEREAYQVLPNSEFGSNCSEVTFGLHQSILRKEVSVDLGAPEVELGRWQRRGI